MQQLIKNPELAGELREYLEEQIAKGLHWVVYDADHPISNRWDLQCFPGEAAAEAEAREHQQILNWHVALPVTSRLFQH